MNAILLTILIGACFATEENPRAPTAGEAPSYTYPYATYKYPYAAYAAVPAYYFAPAPAVYYTAPVTYVVPKAPAAAPPVGASVYYGTWQ